MVNIRGGEGEEGNKRSEKVLGKEEEGIMINDGREEEVLHVVIWTPQKGMLSLDTSI